MNESFDLNFKDLVEDKVKGITKKVLEWAELDDGRVGNTELIKAFSEEIVSLELRVKRLLGS